MSGEIVARVELPIRLDSVRTLLAADAPYHPAMGRGQRADIYIVIHSDDAPDEVHVLAIPYDGHGVEIRRT